jgi:hypothetical protein
MDTRVEPELTNKISELTAQFYSENKKNILFKNSQKKECANTIVESIGIDGLLKRTFFIFPNTNRVFLDYPVFKSYATPDNYSHIVNYIVSLFSHCINIYGTFEAHVNLEGFTLSAAERYKEFMHLYINVCMAKYCEFSEKIDKMYIYNTPNTFQSISKILMPLVDNVVKNKIVIYDKHSSNILISNLSKK